MTSCKDLTRLIWISTIAYGFTDHKTCWKQMFYKYVYSVKHFTKCHGWTQLKLIWILWQNCDLGLAIANAWMTFRWALEHWSHQFGCRWTMLAGRRIHLLLRNSKQHDIYRHGGRRSEFGPNVWFYRVTIARWPYVRIQQFNTSPTLSEWYYWYFSAPGIIAASKEQYLL